VLLAGAHWVAIDTASGDRGTASALNGLINADDDRSIVGDEGAQEEHEEEFAQTARGPGGAAEDTMIVLEVELMAEAHDAQSRGDGALTRSENGTDEQDLGMFPGAFAEDSGEGVQDLYNRTWQVKHFSILS